MAKSKTRSPRPLTAAQPTRSPQQPRDGSKQAVLIQLLSRPEGASLDDLIAGTGWLPHTTRAALSGLRRRGYAIERRPADGGRSLYRIAAPEPDTAAKKPRSGRRRGSAHREARARP
jgi:Protein of unknown function (DUF3489)